MPANVVSMNASMIECLFFFLLIYLCVHSRIVDCVCLCVCSCALGSATLRKRYVTKKKKKREKKVVEQFAELPSSQIKLHRKTSEECSFYDMEKTR